jgi:hypothetical protein
VGERGEIAGRVVVARLGECAVGQYLVHRLAEQVEAVGGDVPPLIPMRSMVGLYDDGRGTDGLDGCWGTHPSLQKSEGWATHRCGAAWALRCWTGRGRTGKRRPSAEVSHV